MLLIVLLSLILTGCTIDDLPPQIEVRPPTTGYSIERGTMLMEDGTPLAVSWWIPQPRFAGERFPALLEMLPYRKDDDFYARDFPLYDWFASRGFLMVKVDVRGTGGSGGVLPDREYSDDELHDAEQIIAALAVDPRSNGRVGMWGISWGGFNAIQVALRQPPALGAILALHASDDLFHDDVRYIDGVLHIDRYALQIDHSNALPATPDYRVDSMYFRERFDTRPWILTYLAQSADGPFWRANSLRHRRDDLRVPAYMIGGLLDGYRDAPIRALDAQRAAPVKVEIGPWVHAWPDNGTPGPGYEWRERAARWWDHWLRDIDTGLLDEPRLLVFQRDAQPPDPSLTNTAGSWRFEDWPVRGASTDTAWLADDDRLSVRAPAVASKEISYAPGAGTAAGEWWGEPTGDMAEDDARSMVFDGEVATSPSALLGFPRVRIVARHGAPLAHWVARLEDVAPDGRVSLITGGAMNVTQRRSSLAPERAVVGQTDTLTFALHFTTWTLQSGHRLRVSISNAQFPMLWPTPFRMTSTLRLGASLIELPIVPITSAFAAPLLPESTARAARPGVTWLTDSSSGPTVGVDPALGETAVSWHSSGSWTIDSVAFSETEDERYLVRDAAPFAARFVGRKSTTIRVSGRVIHLETTITVGGAVDYLDVTVVRSLSQDGARVRVRTWTERVPRTWH